MKRMRICTLVLALALLFALAGCGGASKTDGSAGTAAPASAASAPTEAPAPTETPAPTEAPAPTETPAPTEAPALTDPPAPADETVYVSTAGEFLEAIAPGAVIELSPGVYDLSAYLAEISGDVSDCVLRGFTVDGWQAEIVGIEKLTIRGAEGGKVEVVAEPRYSDVLSFSACTDISIENITFGHTPEKGNCQGAVLAFERCRNVALDGLDLYGCGTYGVEAEYTVGLALKDCVVRDCSYGIVSLAFCSEVRCEDCAFRDNAGYDMLSLSGSFVLFEGCAFTGNGGSGFLPTGYYRGSESGAYFEGCTFDAWESQRLGEELPGCGSFVIGEGCRFETDPGKRIVHVSSLEQLIESIAPDTQIMLAPGRYNLSDALAGLLARDGEHFNESRPFVRIDKKYDGPELVITGVNGLTIASASGSAADTEIVTDPRYADVLRFENCAGTAVMDLTLGHTDVGECVGDVLHFDRCSDTVLRGLDLYGCGVYGVGTEACGQLTCFDSTIRDCSFGTLELYAPQQRQAFLNCVMTGSASGGFFYAEDGSDGEFFFFRCTFGEGESNTLAFSRDIAAEDCSWSEITAYPDYSEDWEGDYVWEPLDTTCLMAVSFDGKVLTDEYLFLCYESVDRQSGEVSFETGYDVQYLTFAEDGTGWFWENDETGRPFSFEMDSAYSCAISFDDGGEASIGLYADQGGALPDSMEGRLWLALYLDEAVLWFY